MIVRIKERMANVKCYDRETGEIVTIKLPVTKGGEVSVNTMTKELKKTEYASKYVVVEADETDKRVYDIDIDINDKNGAVIGKVLDRNSEAAQNY